MMPGGSAPGAVNSGNTSSNQGGTVSGVGGKGSSTGTDTGTGSGSSSEKPPETGGVSSGGGANTGGTSSGNGHATGDNGGASNGTGIGGKPANSNADQTPDKSPSSNPPSRPTTPPGRGADGDKFVALTFDDGPDAKYTTAILDILKEKGIKATFFVVGQQVNKYPEVLERIADEGHAIGNHTQNHKDLKKQTKAEILKQINLTDKAISDVLGETPKLFRAPYGSLSDTLKQVLKDQGRKHTGWTIDTRDWAGTSIEDMRDMIRHQTKPNGIILMHSFGGQHIKNTVLALPDIIDDLHKLGYTFVTADELP